ncbi:hypothetical protein LL271_22800 [Aurantimonas coralicida]|nr:hypothetical protein [Aurantimonas coralicida]
MVVVMSVEEFERLLNRPIDKPEDKLAPEEG